MLTSKGRESSGSEGRIFWVMGKVKHDQRGGILEGTVASGKRSALMDGS